MWIGSYGRAPGTNRVQFNKLECLILTGTYHHGLKFARKIRSLPLESSQPKWSTPVGSSLTFQNSDKHSSLFSQEINYGHERFSTGTNGQQTVLSKQYKAGKKECTHGKILKCSQMGHSRPVFIPAQRDNIIFLLPKSPVSYLHCA